VDENGKLFGKISVIDIFAVIALVGVISGTAYKFMSPRAAVASGEKTISYTLEIFGVRSFTFDNYHAGDLCFDKKTGTRIGEIVAKSQKIHRERVSLANGSVILAERPDTIAISLDIETKGSETETGFFSGGTYELKAGSEVQLNTKYMEVYGTIRSVAVK
jgi:hypothetical protein